MKVLVFPNQKGGVDKTTSVQNVSKCLSLWGNVVGMIDGDMQANLTSSFKLEDQSNDVRSALFKQEVLTIDDFSKTQVRNLFLLPNRGNTTTKVFEGFALEEQMKLYSSILPRRGEFDFIIFDTGPSLNIDTIAALAASDYMVIPFMYTKYATEGLSKLLKTTYEHTQRGTKMPELLGLFETHYDARIKVSDEIEKNLEQLKTKIMKTKIRVNSRVNRAQGQQKDIFEFGDTKGIEDYTNLTREILSLMK